PLTLAPPPAYFTPSLHDALPICLIDTAGLRDTSDAIEGEGVKRSLTQAGFAFLKILVVNPFDESQISLNEIGDLDLIIATHADVDRKSTRLNSSHVKISYAVFCL